MGMQQMLLGAGAVKGLIGDALFFNTDEDVSADSTTYYEVIFEIPDKYTRWTAVCVGAGAGGSTYGGGGGGALGYLKSPILRSDCSKLYVRAGNGGTGKGTQEGENGGYSSVTVHTSGAGWTQGNHILMVRGGRADENPSGNYGTIWSGTWGHIYSSIYTVNSTYFGGHQGGPPSVTSGGGEISGGGGGAGGWNTTGNGSEPRYGMGAGNNGSPVAGWAGWHGGAGGGDGNNNTSNAAGGGGAGVLLYTGTSFTSGATGDNGYNPGHPGSHSTSTPSGVYNGAYAKAGDNVVNISTPAKQTYPNGTSVNTGKRGEAGSYTKPGDGGFPGGGGAGSANRSYGNNSPQSGVGDGAPGAVRIIMWDDAYHAAEGAPVWYTGSGGTRTAFSDINDEFFLNGTSQGTA